MHEKDTFYIHDMHGVAKDQMGVTVIKTILSFVEDVMRTFHLGTWLS